MIECKWCYEDTYMIFTRECDRCWELRRRIEAAPKLAEKMMKMIELHSKQVLPGEESKIAKS